MTAYEGNEKFIFVSYAHKDSTIVLPIIEALHQAGFRVWYDSGIEAGTEWPAYIEQHLQRCAAVLAFISPASVASVNCRNEINLACMIQKPMLIAHLQKTELAHGMLLQIGALQSIFRDRHDSTASFVNELCRATVLQSSRESGAQVRDEEETPRYSASSTSVDLDWETVLNSGDMHLITELRKNAPVMIANVGSIGTVDTDNLWPIGKYTTAIDSDKNNAVCFHARFIRAIGKEGELPVGLMIFDQNGELVHQDIAPLEFRPNHDRISKLWIIRDSYGMAQRPGTYTALIWVGDCRIYQYKFRLSSSEEPMMAEEPASTEENAKKVREMEQKELKQTVTKLAYPKLFPLIFATIVTFFIYMYTMNGSYYTRTIGFVVLAVYIACLITAFRKVRKYIVKNKILATLLITLVSIYFCIFLFVMSVLQLGKYKAMKQRVAELKEKGIAMEDAPQKSLRFPWKK